MINIISKNMTKTKLIKINHMIIKMKNLTYWNICRRSTRVSADDDKSPLDPPVTPFTAGSEI
jgi:hypothetical protein